jgi:hypothetical protein
MRMEDRPENTCFSAGLPCSGVRQLVADPREGTNFETELVGRKGNDIVPLFGFTWASNYSPDSGEVYEYGGNPSDSGRGTGAVTILSEIDFLADQVVGTPEPATWAMMLFGFAGLGYRGYRQRQKFAGFKTV